MTHFYIINTKWFRVYFWGSYSILEIDVGSLQGREYVLHLFTKEKVWAFHVNRHGYGTINL